jgi:YHS domain-containing protein
MFRALIYSLLGILVFSFVRGVLSILGRAMSDTLRGDATTNRGQTAPKSQPAATLGGELVKDPVCGTFVSIQSKYSRVAEGKTYYFCSEECKTRFAA